jgi:hypothetical protein
MDVGVCKIFQDIQYMNSSHVTKFRSVVKNITNIVASFIFIQSFVAGEWLNYEPKQVAELGF